MVSGWNVTDASCVKKRKRSTERRRGSADRIDLAQRLREFRTAADMTQEVLAQRAHLTPKFISQIENGHVNPSIDVIVRVVEDGLGLPLAAFFAADVGDVREDLEQLNTLMSSQPPPVRRRALRVLKALCDE